MNNLIHIDFKQRIRLLEPVSRDAVGYTLGTQQEARIEADRALERDRCGNCISFGRDLCSRCAGKYKPAVDEHTVYGRPKTRRRRCKTCNTLHAKLANGKKCADCLYNRTG